jgi:hypothetical protein
MIPLPIPLFTTGFTVGCACAMAGAAMTITAITANAMIFFITASVFSISEYRLSFFKYKHIFILSQRFGQVK